MKILIKILILVITTTTLAQKSIKKTVGDFSELKVYDLIEVELIKSDKNAVEITGKNYEDVLVNNKNGTLKIKMKLEEVFDGNDIKVKLYYTNIDVIDANEGAYIYSKEVINQFEIDLNAQEGAKIEMKNIEVKYINIRSVTGATITALGKAKHQDISIYTGGKYDGKLLETENTEVSIRAAGEALVNATDKVIAKVRIGGNIFIYGNPNKIEESKVLGGKIKLVKE